MLPKMSGRPFVLRRQYITNEPIQKKYLGLLVLSLVVPVIVVASGLNFLIYNLLAVQLGIPASVAANLFPAIGSINVKLAIITPVMIMFLLMWGVILSHRFTGPMGRLRREIEEMAKTGDCTRHLYVRKYDDLRPMIDSINLLLTAVAEKEKKGRVD